MRYATLVLLCALAVGVWWQQRIESPMVGARMGAQTFDDYAYYYPTFNFAFSELREGRFPFWNPYQHCGSPFFATAQHLLLYPLNTLFLLLPTGSAMKATTMLHFVLAIVFTFILGRTFGLAPPGALTAGLAFAFSPTLAGLVYLPHHLYGAVWIPLHLALARQVLVGPRRLVPGTLLGVTGAAQYLGGYPMFCLFSVYAVAGYFAWHLATAWLAGTSGRELIASTLALGASAWLAVCLILPQLLPATELALLSPRRLGGLSIEIADPGDPVLHVADAAGWYLSLVGIAALALVAVALVCDYLSSSALFFFFLTVISGLLGLGRQTPLYHLYFMLPTADWFRLPGRFAVLTALGVAMLAGFGVDALGRERTTRKGLFACVASAIVLAVVIALRFGGSFVQPLAEGMLATFAAGKQAASSFHLLGVAAGLLGFALLWLARRRQALIWILPALVYVELFFTFINYSPLPDTHPQLHVLPAHVAQFLKFHQGRDRTHFLPPGWSAMLPPQLIPTDPSAPAPPPPVPTKAGMMNGIYAVSDRENVFPLRLAEYAARMRPPRGIEAGLRLLGHVGSIPQGGFRVTARSPNLRLLDLLGTRFIVEGPGTDFEQRMNPERFPLIYEQDGVRVYTNTAALPRAYVVNQVELIAEPALVLERLSSRTFDPTTAVILEEPPAREPAAPPPAAPAAQASITAYMPSEVRIEATTPSPGFLVLTDQHYPGWEAEVDGQPSPIYRANYLFRAVFLDTGTHVVVFRFVPRSFYKGVILGAAGIGVLGLLVAISRLRRPGTHQSEKLSADYAA